MELSADDIIRDLANQIAKLSVDLAVAKAQASAAEARVAACPCEDCPLRGEDG